MSYRTIVAIVNEHTLSTVAARYAIALATSCKAGLILYAAHGRESSESILHRTALHLDHLYNVATRLNIAVTRVTEVGNIVTLLPRLAEKESADLVCCPLTTEEQYGGSFRPDSVKQLLKSIRSDLAIIRVVTMAKPHPGNILVPLGKVLSDRERRLLLITALAKSFHSRVTLFHLSDNSAAEGMPDEINSFRDRLQQQNVTVLERKGVGDIGKAVTVEAITRHNDLIVLGASGRGVLRKLLFGNPAADVMHLPPCNVILFRSAP